MIKNKTTLFRIVASSIVLGIIIGAGTFKYLSKIGLTSFLDLAEYSAGYNKHGEFVREYNFRRRATLNKNMPWSSIVNNRKFQILPDKEKEKLRNEYYTNTIEPTINCTDSFPAQVEFHFYAEKIEKEIKENGFFEKILSLPKSKVISRISKKYYIAPLKIKTRNDGYNYYVKISTIKSNKTIETLFIRSGESVTTKVPLGSYVLKYSTGKRWYGKKYLFGPETVYSKAEKIFTFTKENDRTSGYSVELFRQINGNLQTKNISKRDW